MTDLGFYSTSHCSFSELASPYEDDFDNEDARIEEATNDQLRWWILKCGYTQLQLNRALRAGWSLKTIAEHLEGAGYHFPH